MTTMRGILCGAANADITTYVGPFDFIDSQQAFDQLFPDMHPVLPTDNTPDAPTTAMLSSFIDLSCNRTSSISYASTTLELWTPTLP